MNDPIVVWPPGTFQMSCADFGSYYDCTSQYPLMLAYGAIGVCCPAW